MKKWLLLLIMFVAPVFFSGSVSAATQVSDAKASLEALYSCYKNGGLQSSTKKMSYSYSDSSYYKKLSLVNNTGLNMSLPLPTGHYADDSVNCQDIIIGAEGSKSNEYPGLKGIYGVSIPDGDINSMYNGSVENFLKSMGYEKVETEVESDRETWCFNLPYSSKFVPGTAGAPPVITLDEAIYTHYACVEVDKDTHWFTWEDDWHVTDGPLDDTFDQVYWTTPQDADGEYSKLQINVTKAFLAGWDCWELCKDSFYYYLSKDGGNTIEGRANSFYSKAVELGSASYSYMAYYAPGEPQYWRDPVAEKEIVVTYDLQNPETKSAEKAMANISAQTYKTYDDLKFTNDEVFDLYMDYLQNYYNSGSATVYCGAASGSESAYYDGKVANGSYVKFTIKTADSPDGKTCYAAAPTKNKNKKVNGVNPSTMHFDGTKLTFEEMIDALEGMTIEDEISSEFMTPPSSESDQYGSTEEVAATCANSGGAMSLGWIVCPILDWMGQAAEGLYDNYLEPALQVKPQLFAELVPDVNDYDQDGDTAEMIFQFAETKEAWDQFQMIANICFIILFLVVIFSQLTGVGIDNYGIKRILPKLIVAAILVNLSYYLCMLAVDFSNILGNGLQAMFDGLATGTSQINIGADGGQWVNSNGFVETSKTIGATAISGVAILVALVAMGGAIWANPAILLSLLVGALGIVIAIVFLFVLLAAREAAVVVLVVLSPLAFVCYMLPNTKKLFDKWVKMGEGLLLVYPIAGLLVGGGNFVSKLLLSSGFANGGFASALTAMIVGIIPIFFIPSVLKSSFAAMGNLGAKISGFGDRFRGGVDRKIRNSEGFRDKSNRLRAGVNKNGELTGLGKLRAKSAQSNFAKTRAGRMLGLGGVARSQARGMAAAGKTRAEDEAAGATLINEMAKEGISGSTAIAGLGSSFGAGTEGAYYGSRFLDAARRGDVVGMNSTLEAMRASNMKSKDIAKIVRHAENTGGYGFKDTNSRAAWYRDLSKKYGGDFLATDFELGTYAQTGGSMNGGVLGGYGDLAAARDSSGNRVIGLDDIKPQDVGKMSGDSMAGAIRSGLIDASMAQRSIVENPNLSVDKKIMLSAAANGVSFDPSVAIKDQVDQWMAGDFSSGATINQGGVVSAVNSDLISAWSAATPDAVNVVQNFNAGGQQIQPVDVKIDHEVKATGAPGTYSADDIRYAEWQAGHWEENKRNLERTNRDTTQNNPPSR